MANHITHCIILVLKVSKNVGFSLKILIILYCIILLFKASKNGDFMTEHIIQYIILLLKVSKNANFTIEHFIHCNLKQPKLQSANFMMVYIIHCIIFLLKNQCKYLFHDKAFYDGA